MDYSNYKSGLKARHFEDTVRSHKVSKVSL